jgi:hypothetical protein
MRAVVAQYSDWLDDEGDRVRVQNFHFFISAGASSPMEEVVKRQLREPDEVLLN